MEIEVKYDVTEALQKQASKQLFFSFFLQDKWMGLAIMPVFSVASLFMYGESKWIIFSVCLAIGLVLILLWIKTYYSLMRVGLDQLRTIDNPLATLKLNDEAMEMSNSNGMRKVSWDKMDKLIESKDFFILITGKVPLVCLPKKEFNDEESAWIKNLLKEQ